LCRFRAEFRPHFDPLLSNEKPTLALLIRVPI
jgi:hypothetical protein